MKVTRQHISRAAAIIVIIVSCLVLTGWFFDIAVLKSVSPSYISMKFNTALCFLLAAIALLLVEKTKAKIFIYLISLLLLSVGVLTTIEFIFNCNLGIDEIFFKEGTGTPYTFYPGRPGFATAIEFIIISGLLVAMTRKKIYIFSWISLFVCFITALFSLISYAFGNPNLISVGSFTVMALHTSLLFIILCIGIYKTRHFHLVEISFQRRLILGFISIAIVFMVIFYLDNKNDQRYISATNLTANTEKAINLSADIFSSLTRMESGVRGYLVTDNKELIKPLDTGRERIFIHINQLKNITAEIKEEENKIDTLTALVAKRLQLFDNELYLKSKLNQEHIKQDIEEATGLTFRILNILTEIKEDQKMHLEKKQSENKKIIDDSDKAIYFFGFCLLMILIGLLVVIFNNTNARIKAEEDARHLALTLEKRVEKRTQDLLKSQYQFQFTLDNMLEGVQIIGFDWKFIYVNDSMLKQVGYNREGLIGFSVKDKYPGFERTEVYRACTKCFEKRVPMHIEDKFVHFDGSVHYFECSIQPVPEGVFILSVDITDRKMVLEKIKASEDKYRAVIDNSLFAILLARPGEKVFESNKAASEMFGYSEEEFLNISREQILDFSDPLLAQRLKERDINGSSKGEFIAIKKNGQKFYCEVTSVIFKDINGDKMTCAMIADISQRKITEEQLTAANDELRKLTLHLNSVREEERQKLSREVQEELGQLASALKMDIDWINLHIPDPDVKIKARMKNALYVLQVMIDSTRKIASYLRPGMIDELGLNATLKWQCAEFEKINKTPSFFHEHFDDSHLSGKVRTELFRICQESLNNIVRHAQANLVIVSVNKTDSGLELSIKDDGKGFDPSEKNDHLGLVGLRERALSIDGELIVESEPGKGTNIRILVPVSD